MLKWRDSINIQGQQTTTMGFIQGVGREVANSFLGGSLLKQE